MVGLNAWEHIGLGCGSCCRFVWFGCGRFGRRFFAEFLEEGADDAQAFFLNDDFGSWCEGA
jgi:hypothetical protein